MGYEENERDDDAPPVYDPDDPEETHALQVMLMGYKFYRSESHLNITHRRRINAYALPPRHQKVLFDPPVSLLSKLSQIDECISTNAEFLDKILQTSYIAFNVDPRELPQSTAELSHETYAQVGESIDKVRSVLRQFVRDWSVEGHVERGVAYGRVLRTLAQRWKDPLSRHSVKVLVPGAGLGRLAMEIAEMGFQSQGNEWSYSMLAASQFVLNCTQEANQYMIHPFINNFSHQESRDNQVRGIRIPDVSPSTALSQSPAGWKNPYEELLPKDEQGAEEQDTTLAEPCVQSGESCGATESQFSRASERFSMIAGDFVQCYREPAQFDAVCTSFFIDTAANPLLYIDTIYRTLKPGGIWVNVGPLLWHWDGKRREGGGVELSLEELMMVVQSKFKVLKRESSVQSGYTGDNRALGKWTYNLEFWVAEKRE